MTATDRFLASTRGRILTHLLRQPATVAELAKKVGVSTNAARQHVTGLERDGYVERYRLKHTVSKPAAMYRATPDGEALFPKAYEPVLDAVAEQYAAEHADDEDDLGAFLQQVGLRLARRYAPAADATHEERIDAAVGLLAELGGVLETSQSEDGVVWLEGHGCPLSGVVKHHPEFCTMIAVMLEDMIVLPVEPRCRNEGRNPSCRFVIGAQDGAPDRG